ncbi:hypothetical protein PBAL39_25310 [Pedobacter sp. BAL39]|uniref:heavy-metal-associated domain-containing protein n=1 Tax=Pedobacter sp. BAL39 TaxID=391596 RepID=UPI00015592FA|nr:heavy-metal-associated domain-containing protein [Pedobacter sp. BAL39]EDM36648.1 hypothetical protein PBAL39_25310 [Pedobacter sp. BAL39]
METLKFKTNIKCGGCIATVTPFLDKIASISNWEVDTSSADKILTIQGNETLNTAEIKSSLADAGYVAEEI